MIRRYKDSDFKTISKWYKARGMKIPSKAALSDSGWIADERVAGFLYVTNSNIALIDGIISNPDTLPSARKVSLQQLCSVLVDSAVMMGYTNVIAATSNESIKDICHKLKFKKTSYELFVLSEPSMEREMDEESYDS